jgi:DNA-binding MarR family transcriptional regulator
VGGAAIRPGHPRHQLVEEFNSPVRLSVMAALMGLDKAEFSFIRDLVEVSDSVLSKQLTVLEQAGHLKINKVTFGRRAKTWLALTAAGREAFTTHRAVLLAIANGASETDAQA